MCRYVSLMHVDHNPYITHFSHMSEMQMQGTCEKTHVKASYQKVTAPKALKTSDLTHKLAVSVHLPTLPTEDSLATPKNR